VKHILDVRGDVAGQLRHVDARLAALKAGANPDVKLKRVFGPVSVPITVLGAVHLLGVKLTVLCTLETIGENRLLQIGFEVCRVASVCLGL
jgi:hypothetical protein